MRTERRGEAFEEGVRLTVIGKKLETGKPAPPFTLESLDPGSTALRTVTLSDSAGQVRLLHIVNSVDTPVCHIGACRWDTLRSDLPSDVRVYTISMDLPFAQARWRTAENGGHEMLSAHRDERFGEDYGVLLDEWRLLQRAVIVIGRDDRVVYTEYVADQMREPDYDAAVAAARRAV